MRTPHRSSGVHDTHTIQMPEWEAHHIVADLAAKVHALPAAAGCDAIGLQLRDERRHIDEGVVVRLHDEAHVEAPHLLKSMERLQAHERPLQHFMAAVHLHALADAGPF